MFKVLLLLLKIRRNKATWIDIFSSHKGKTTMYLLKFVILTHKHAAFFRALHWNASVNLKGKLEIEFSNSKIEKMNHMQHDIGPKTLYNSTRNWHPMVLLVYDRCSSVASSLLDIEETLASENSITFVLTNNGKSLLQHQLWCRGNGHITPILVKDENYMFGDNKFITSSTFMWRSQLTLEGTQSILAIARAPNTWNTINYSEDIMQ